MWECDPRVCQSNEEEQYGGADGNSQQLCDASLDSCSERVDGRYGLRDACGEFFLRHCKRSLQTQIQERQWPTRQAGCLHIFIFQKRRGRKKLSPRVVLCQGRGSDKYAANGASEEAVVPNPDTYRH